MLTNSERPADPKARKYAMLKEREREGKKNKGTTTWQFPETSTIP